MGTQTRAIPQLRAFSGQLALFRRKCDQLKSAPPIQLSWNALQRIFRTNFASDLNRGGIGFSRRAGAWRSGPSENVYGKAQYALTRCSDAPDRLIMLEKPLRGGQERHSA
jgi:hypothetical protein